MSAASQPWWGATTPVRVLCVGVGGLGSPVAWALAHGGPAARPVELTLLDDDVVDATNLHRQTLYDERDVGASKVERAAAVLARWADEHATPLTIDARRSRLTPTNAAEMVREHDVIVEGADNLPTKFLAADAAALAGRPIVHAGVVRWSGWAKAVMPGASACLRCVFEDVPRDRVETCADAGVVGALVGVVGAVQAGLLSRLLAGDATVGDTLTRLDARVGVARTVPVRRRPDCPLCGEPRRIADLSAARYAPACSV
jgi:molybdopterin-synthase adenylyltransferase